MSDSRDPHGLQPTRLLCPWDFLGKSTGVGCYCLLRVFFTEHPQKTLLEKYVVINMQLIGSLVGEDLHQNLQVPTQAFVR